MASSYDSGTERLHFIGLLRDVIRRAYYYLPTVLVISIGWCFVSMTVVFVAPMWAAVVSTARRITENGEFTRGMMVDSFRKYFWQSQAAFIPFFVLVNTTGWLWLSATRNDDVVLGLLCFLSFDAMGLYCYLMIYYFQFLTEDGTAVTGERGVLDESFATARKSTVIAVGRVRTTVGLFLFSLSIALLLGFTVAGFVLLAPGVIALTLVIATDYVSVGD